MTTSAGSTARRAVKSLARGVAVLFILPVLLTFRLQSLLVGRNRSLEDHSELMSLLPGLPGRYLRRAFLACVLEECHPSASIGFGVLFSQAGARIGEDVYIGPRCHIGLVTLERDALLGAGVHVTSGARTHGTDDPSRPIRDQEGTLTRVRIGTGAWIGSAAVVMCDVGARTVVGAGAVVTKPLPEGVVAAGVPARIIGDRRSDGLLFPERPAAPGDPGPQPAPESAE